MQMLYHFIKETCVSLDFGIRRGSCYEPPQEYWGMTTYLPHWARRTKAAPNESTQLVFQQWECQAPYKEKETISTRGQECTGWVGFWSTWGRRALPFCPGILLLALDLGGSFHWQHLLWLQNHAERNQAQTTEVREREASFSGNRRHVIFKESRITRQFWNPYPSKKNHPFLVNCMKWPAFPLLKSIHWSTSQLAFHLTGI